MDEKDNIFPSQENDTPETNTPVEPEGESKPDYDNGTPWYQQSTTQQSYTPPREAEPTYSPYSNQQSYSANYYNSQPTPPQEPEKKSNKGRKLLAVFLSVVVVLCAVLGAFLFKDSRNQNNIEETKKGDAQLQIQTSDEVKIVDGSNAVSVYEKVSPSCVGIILYSTGSSLFSSGNSANTSNIAGQGSGIIMGENSDSTKTYIITCAHVIASAGSSGYKVVVQDHNGEQYDATVVGFDSKTDLGVLSIAQTGLKAASFGDSSKIKIGETVYAIGNPGGTEFFGSFTKGMVSAIDRSVSSEIGYDMKCVQHDAAINPGNSGGALINEAGQIIGINSSKIASTEYEGMGFAIPITSAQPIINDIIANGYVTNRPKLGIKYSAASNYQQYAMVVQIKGLPAGSLIIAEISSDSAFKGTKAEVGDLIIAVNGEEMTTADVLLDKIENGNVGDKLTLTLCRINQNYEISEFDVTVTLVEDTGTTEEMITTTVFDWNQFFGY
ncbi:MAG: trypsin-like peptidase domain-containing protein [Clostridia bacterium]|nr:trypsin-like peptidase domain-containing protein [Clostridia bacterium]